MSAYGADGEEKRKRRCTAEHVLRERSQEPSRASTVSFNGQDRVQSCVAVTWQGNLT